MNKDHKDKIMIPYEKNFTQNKKVSDRIYSWILLNREVEKNFAVSISDNLKCIYKEIEISYTSL